jgi:hypothetical protein
MTNAVYDGEYSKVKHNENAQRKELEYLEYLKFLYTMVNICAFLTSALEGSEWPASCYGRFIPEKEIDVPHCRYGHLCPCR